MGRDALEERIDNGVWGGCSERERRRILKRRRAELGIEDTVDLDDDVDALV